MIKRNTLISLAAIILVLIIVSVYYEKTNTELTVNKKISQYIKTNCPDLTICRINISKFINFNWDTVCFPGSGATLNFNPEIIPAPLPLKYKLQNPKMIFIEQGRIVLFEEIPMEVEHTPAGTVLFEYSDKYCYQKGVDSIFNVKKGRLNADYYTLYK